MIVLGIEGTAHTVGASLLDRERIYSSVSRTFKPEKGGINPREAAEFHFNNISTVISEAIEKSGIHEKQIELVAFSRGPGLPPSLKITATAARAMAIRLNVPIVGVNHPLGHVEIGRRETGAVDPVMLYVSGGNTQIIAHKNGYYRVFGETLDIGIGNMLDKLARYMGFPFPGGPKIEELALSGKKLLKMPYSVKGMDTAFSGMYTNAINYIRSGETSEDVSYSVQEHAFSMLVETLERAIFTTGKKSILLAGGVARNRNLRNKIELMARDAGIPVFETPDEYCMDNGAMIGQAGLLTMEHLGPQKMEDTRIDQFYRIDQAVAPWVIEDETVYEDRGAESSVQNTVFHEFRAVRKTRIAKSYRNPELDAMIRGSRMKREISMLVAMQREGIPVPSVFSADTEKLEFTMEKIGGKSLNISPIRRKETAHDLGKIIGKMHSVSMCHGDLTMNNIIIHMGKPVLIDPSMGTLSGLLQDMAYDLRLLKESADAFLENGDEFFALFIESYRECFSRGTEVIKEMDKVEKRRRYA